MFNFDYSYLSLPKKFHSLTQPSSCPFPEIFLLNQKLINKFNLQLTQKKILDVLFDKNNYKKSFAQNYAGHQFGYFTKLGDGRAIIIGEHLLKNNLRIDIQLKGAGLTKYSRNGDGKATLRSMIREYLISEAMHYLNISSSRSLGVIKSGESILRQNLEDGGVLVRMMKSHIRIGTFEYASYFGSSKDLKHLTSYTINRLYPHISNSENPPLALLNTVMNKQIDLVVNWMRVGFIHGVMNTDNTSISAESFDYGPCAFINSYNPSKVYSSIDHNGRYAFGNQPKVIKWNICRFAESLIPIINENKKIAIELAQSVIDKFDSIWKKKYYSMMLNKIGIFENKKSLHSLIDDLLSIMENNNMDFTNTFWYLSQHKISKTQFNSNSNFVLWQKKWNNYIKKMSCLKESKQIMKKNNPIIIPRNHVVNEVIEKAMNGNTDSLNKLLKALTKPYQKQEGIYEYTTPTNSHDDACFQTYCGT